MPPRPALRVKRGQRCSPGLCLALSVALLLAGCREEPVVQRETLYVFGGEATIELQGLDPAQARAALVALAARFNEMNAEWHAWEPSALTALNAAIARGERSRPPDSIRDLILRSQPLSIRSDGLFDPAVGELMALWGFHTSEFPVAAPLPSMERIDAWRARRPSIADVVVDDEEVYSLNPAMQLDFGGIAEGVAVEEAQRVLEAHGARNALLSLGGDIYAIGDAGGRPWRVGIRDPYGGVLAGVELQSGEALFTSGNYQKFREAPSGARWAHILDPRSGQPVLGTAAVVVLHPDPVLADIAATALMVGGPARFAQLVAGLQLHCALLLTEENEMIITAAMERRIELLRQPVRLGEPLGGPGTCAGDRGAVAATR